MRSTARVCHKVCIAMVVFISILLMVPNQAHGASSRKLHGGPATEGAAEKRTEHLPTLGCRDSRGQLVDWWVILKLPNGTRYGVFTSAGSETAHGDSSADETAQMGLEVGHSGNKGDGREPGPAAGAGGWVVARHLNSLTSPLSRTLLPLYDPTTVDRVGHLMYNDESPTGRVEFYRAHAKGVLAFKRQQMQRIRKQPGSWRSGSMGAGMEQGRGYGRTADWGRGSRRSIDQSPVPEQVGGFWLQHSAPKFPNLPRDNYSGVAYAQQLFGQHFVCLTLGDAAIEMVAASLQTSFPFVYSCHMPAKLRPGLYQVAGLMSGHHPILPTSHVAHIQTHVSNEALTLVYKSRSLWVELYSSLVERYFHKGMLLQTWLRGTGAMPSFCPPQHRYISHNVLALYMKSANRGWIGYNDHSKWAVSIEAASAVQSAGRGTTEGREPSARAASTRIVCFGDMNREYSQMYRGGGAVCFDHNDALWHAFSDLVVASSKCRDDDNSTRLDVI